MAAVIRNHTLNLLVQQFPTSPTALSVLPKSAKPLWGREEKSWKFQCTFPDDCALENFNAYEKHSSILTIQSLVSKHPKEVCGAS